MLKELFKTFGIRQNPDPSHHYGAAQSRIVPSVFHTLILPLVLSIGSPVSGALYFLFAVGAYLTIFREKNSYVVLFLKIAAAIAGWILLFGFIGAIGAAS